MKKTILLCIIVLMLMGGTVIYAGNGDMIVNGKLGIGTSLPLTKLHVKTGIDQNIFVTSGPSYGGADGIALVSVNNANTAYKDLNVAAKNIVLNATGGTGHVGIGTTNTGTYALSVAGTTWCSYGYWSDSDKKLKKNILPLSDSLSTVLKLEGVSYEWNDDYYKVQESPEGTEVLKKKNPEGRHYGVIAQEIEKFLPEVVKEDADGTKAVAYNEIIPYLIEAIKEQQKQIDSLTQQINDLTGNSGGNKSK